ncbi:MAG TPA: NAD(P)-binding domain-containing protein [Chloroflexota bacterium]|nr:NAD(P)-binding domain-containing protein [Chloroflexota bacterium]
MIPIAIVGAGPHGISVAAHCREAGLEFRQFGRTMVSWQEHMPAGMRLKSSMAASNIVDPARAYDLPAFGQQTGAHLANPLPIEDFVSYGRWIRQRVDPDLDERLVSRISKNGAFRLDMEDGELVHAEKVVLALGPIGFAWIPPEFAEVPRSLADHTTRAGALSRFRDKRVAVIGSGQSAQESAALLYEAGADVEIVTRRPELPRLGRNRGFSPILQRLAPKAVAARVYHPTDLGRQPYHIAIAYPELFRRLPRRLQQRISWSVIKPAGSRWLANRLGHVRVTHSDWVVGARASGSRLELELAHAGPRVVDFALLATGFKPDMRTYRVLDQELLARVATDGGYPVLRLDFQTTVPGLYAIGPIAARDHGPITRFVCGSLVYERLLMPSLGR